MCFIIDPHGVVPSCRVAWKVVHVSESGYVYPIHFRWHKKRRIYQPGIAVHDRSGKAKTWVRSPYDRRSRVAHSGIYVYLTKKAAMCENSIPGTGWGDRCILMRVSVDPKDFLFRCKVADIATYRRVDVDVDQPYFDWV